MPLVSVARCPLPDPPRALALGPRRWGVLCAHTLHGWDGVAEEPQWTVALPEGTEGMSLLVRAGEWLVAPVRAGRGFWIRAVLAETGETAWDLSESSIKPDFEALALHGDTLWMTGRRGSDDIVLGLDVQRGRIACEHENPESNLLVEAAGMCFVSGYKSLRPVERVGVGAPVLTFDRRDSLRGLRAVGPVVVVVSVHLDSGVASLVGWDAARGALAGRVEVGAKVGVLRVHESVAPDRILASTSDNHELLRIDLASERIVWRRSIAPYDAHSAAWIDGCIAVTAGASMADLPPRRMLFDPETGDELPSDREVSYGNLRRADDDLVALVLGGVERLRWTSA